MSTKSSRVPIHLMSSQNRLLITHGKVVCGNELRSVDIFVEGRQIKEIGQNLNVPGGVRIIDATNCYVLPGGIDPHCHFDFEFMGEKTIDDFYAGTKAAIAGGTTTIVDFAFPDTETGSILTGFDQRISAAHSKVCCDYAIHSVVTKWSSKMATEMETLVQKHGVTSFKIFMTYNFAFQDSDLYAFFETCKQLNVLPLVHAENGKIIAQNSERLLKKGITGPEGHLLSRPEELEADAIFHAATVAKQVDCKLYVVHIMSKFAAEIFEKLKTRWNLLEGETLAAALASDGSNYYKDYTHSAGHVVSPPLRADQSTPDYLLDSLKSGAIRVLASDHCSFNCAQKSRGRNDFTKIPSGVNGVEERMMVLWEKAVNTQKMSVVEFAHATSTNAAKIFGLYPRKGLLAEGSDADIVIWNPSAKHVISAKNHQSKSDFNIFEGLVCNGKPQYVISKGRVCLDNNELRVVEGHGSYVARVPLDNDPAKTMASVSRTISTQMPTPPSKTNGHSAAAATANETAPSVVETVSSNAFEEGVFETSAAHVEDGSRHVRGHRPEGSKNMQDTTFQIQGGEVSDARSSIRVHNPPGGYSRGFW